MSNAFPKHKQLSEQLVQKGKLLFALLKIERIDGQPMSFCVDVTRYLTACGNRPPCDVTDPSCDQNAGRQKLEADDSVITIIEQ